MSKHDKCVEENEDAKSLPDKFDMNQLTEAFNNAEAETSVYYNHQTCSLIDVTGSGSCPICTFRIKVKQHLNKQFNIVRLGKKQKCHCLECVGVNGEGEVRGFAVIIPKLAIKWLMEDKRRVYVVSDIEKRDKMRKLYPELISKIICADEVTWDKYSGMYEDTSR